MTNGATLETIQTHLRPTGCNTSQQTALDVEVFDAGSIGGATSDMLQLLSKAYEQKANTSSVSDVMEASRWGRLCNRH